MTKTYLYFNSFNFVETPRAYQLNLGPNQEVYLLKDLNEEMTTNLDQLSTQLMETEYHYKNTKNWDLLTSIDIQDANTYLVIATRQTTEIPEQATN